MGQSEANVVIDQLPRKGDTRSKNQWHIIDGYILLQLPINDILYLNAHNRRSGDFYQQTPSG